MIVTIDFSSSYRPVPRLRLFCQPAPLLPPPPDEIFDDSLAYLLTDIDQSAGMSKISRTGETVYVRQAKHLPKKRDLSIREDDRGLFEEVKSPAYQKAYHEKRNIGFEPKVNNPQVEVDGEGLGKFTEVEASCLHSERGVTFWKFNIEVELGEQQTRIAYRINNGPATGFWIPAKRQTMNIAFHSGNGFSLGVDPDELGGPDPLWRDILNHHQYQPYHILIGGGNQIYNDVVMKRVTRFHAWLNTKNDSEKLSAPFTSEMQQELETFYLERYSRCFSQGMFSLANSQIPMVNMWDDHDIVAGFGSYSDDFMSSPVISGLGNVAFKYYMLFQHQSLAVETSTDEPTWILGVSPGPYINHLSQSLFMYLGKKVAFLGLDCRTERTVRIQGNSDSDMVLTWLGRETRFSRKRRMLVCLHDVGRRSSKAKPGIYLS